MKTFLKILIPIAFLTLAACEEKGPMEEAGEKIDESVENVKDKAEDAADEVEEGVEEVKDEIDDAGS